MGMLADGDITDGDVVDGDVTDGDVVDGDITDGDMTDGDVVLRSFQQSKFQIHFVDESCMLTRCHPRSNVLCR